MDTFLNIELAILVSALTLLVVIMTIMTIYDVVVMIIDSISERRYLKKRVKRREEEWKEKNKKDGRIT